ncbi:endonuclease/exonuclease/phosphatase family protein [Phenylobacterium conjunctum]|uniref:Endonuclease/exonuclease/phosphatase family protein n=1 Tax=Phenylobacterium conjunctum TaxID=1298959 RepID=A0ABW3T0M6_9CAUL
MSWIRRVLAALTPGLMFGLCGLCVVAALAALKGGDHGRLDILTHFTPFWLIGSLMACAYAVIAAPPLRVVFGVVGAAGLMASLSLMLPEYLRPIPKAAADAPAQLKVIQFNAWRNNADISGTARWLADQKADVIIMEEAEPPLIAEVEATTGLHLTCPKCGISIYTRAKPLKAPKVTEPPGPTDWRLRPPVALARIPLAGKTVTLVGTHTVWPTQPTWQRGQGQYLAQLLDQLPRTTTVLAGDFNSAPWSFARRAEDKLFGLTRITRGVYSWPARSVLKPEQPLPAPILPIDHIYVGSDFKIVSVKRGPRLGSDHYPIVAVVSLQP